MKLVFNFITFTLPKGLMIVQLFPNKTIRVIAIRISQSGYTLIVNYFFVPFILPGVVR
jgi:hypothetical protein